jgi:hypothetical protein
VNRIVRRYSGAWQTVSRACRECGIPRLFPGAVGIFQIEQARMNNRLAKSDPETNGWSDLVRDGKTSWDGVRNYKPRNDLRTMRPGDQVLFYH